MRAKANAKPYSLGKFEVFNIISQTVVSIHDGEKDALDRAYDLIGNYGFDVLVRPHGGPAS